MTTDLTIRMYNVGFGDAILITATHRNRPWRMLIDCGVHPHGQSVHPISTVVSDIIETVTDENGAHIDVVVGTHRHRDHVVGFEDEHWQDVAVDEVWLPWTENPRDPKAVDLRTLHTAAVARLAQSFQANSAGAHLLANCLTNEAAMATLQDGFAGRPRHEYISRPERIQARDVPGLPGAQLWILGPPMDESAMRAMNPPRQERWFAPPPAQSTNPDAAFRPPFVHKQPEYARLYPELVPPAPTLDSIVNVGKDDSALMVASWLDRVINNTSIVFVLKIGKATLLFPGDAQWGVWRDIIADPTVAQLLGEVGVYKVSHHGSHNGSPRSLITFALPNDVVSLMSVKPVAEWKNVPKPNLVDALRDERRKLVRTDGRGLQRPATRGSNGLWLELAIPT